MKLPALPTVCVLVWPSVCAGVAECVCVPGTPQAPATLAKYTNACPLQLTWCAEVAAINMRLVVQSVIKHCFRTGISRVFQ